MTSRAQNNRQDLVLKGTATVPGLAFQGDNNTGIYSPGANEIAISTGGIPALAVDSAQRVTLAYELAATEGGTGIGTYTTGDILYASGTNTLSKLSIGTNGQVLTVASGVPAWTATAAAGVSSISFGSTGLTPSTATTGAVTVAGTLAPGYGGTGLATYAAGDIIYATGAGTLARLPIGTAGQILTVSGTAPSWTTGAAAGVSSISFGSTGLTPSTATTGAVSVAGTLATSNGGTGLTTFTGSNRALYSTSASAITAGTLPVAAGGTGGTDQATARSGLGLGTIATQASSSVSITGGSLTGLTTVRVNTSSALSSAESLSVSAPASTDGVVSRVATNAQFNFVGQNASGSETFTLSGNGQMIVNPTNGTGSPITPFTGACGKFVNVDEWAIEAYLTNTNNVSLGAMAVRVNNVNNSLIQFYYNTTTAPVVGTSVVGNITTNGSSTAYNTTSDYRLKTNVADMTDGLSKLKALRPVTFEWKNNPSLGPVCGFIAHEVQSVFPQAVTGEKDAVNADGSIKPQGLDQSTLVSLLVSAVQQLSARIEALEAKAG